jgi:Colicin E5 ribonuclease domain
VENGAADGLGKLAGLGIDAILAARAAKAAEAAVDLDNLTNKIVRQMASRGGWTKESIVDTIQQAQESGDVHAVTNKMTGGAATEYVSPSTGRFVVVDNATKQVIQVSDSGFKPNYMAK